MAATKNATPKTFSAAKFEDARSKKGITRRALSDAVKVTEGTIYNWGVGKSIPDANQLQVLAMMLGVDSDHLLE